MAPLEFSHPGFEKIIASALEHGDYSVRELLELVEEADNPELVKVLVAALARARDKQNARARQKRKEADAAIEAAKSVAAHVQNLEEAIERARAVQDELLRRMNSGAEPPNLKKRHTVG